MNLNPNLSFQNFMKAAIHAAEMEETERRVADSRSANAADVVEVVRCKDCIYWEEYDGTNGELNCGCCSEILDRTTYYLFFCADGNRKDGDED